MEIAQKVYRNEVEVLQVQYTATINSMTNLSKKRIMNNISNIRINFTGEPGFVLLPTLWPTLLLLFRNKSKIIGSRMRVQL